MLLSVVNTLHITHLFVFNHVSMHLNRKIKSPLRMKLGKKKQNTVEIADEPTVQITPARDDPIMEDREDVDPSAVEDVDEEDRCPPVGDKYGSNEPIGVVQDVTDDDSVMTEPTADNADALSTVKEEPSKEEAELMAEKATSASATREATMEEETLDESTLGSSSSPANQLSAFCGCFGV